MFDKKYFLVAFDVIDCQLRWAIIIAQNLMRIGHKVMFDIYLGKHR